MGEGVRRDMDELGRGPLLLSAGANDPDERDSGPAEFPLFGVSTMIGPAPGLLGERKFWCGRMDCVLRSRLRLWTNAPSSVPSSPSSSSSSSRSVSPAYGKDLPAAAIECLRMSSDMWCRCACVCVAGSDGIRANWDAQGCCVALRRVCARGRAHAGARKSSSQTADAGRDRRPVQGPCAKGTQMNRRIMSSPGDATASHRVFIGLELPGGS